MANNTRSSGLGPGSRVLLIERQDGRQMVHNALVVSVSMQPDLLGTRGEMSIEAAFVTQFGPGQHTFVSSRFVVHVSHPDWIDGRAALAYDDAQPRTPAVLAVLQAQHVAIDMLIARVALLDHTFRPSQSGDVWDALVAGNQAIRHLTMIEQMYGSGAKEAACIP